MKNIYYLMIENYKMKYMKQYYPYKYLIMIVNYRLSYLMIENYKMKYMKEYYPYKYLIMIVNYRVNCLN